MKWGHLLFHSWSRLSLQIVFGIFRYDVNKDCKIKTLKKLVQLWNKVYKAENPISFYSEVIIPLIFIQKWSNESECNLGEENVIKEQEKEEGRKQAYHFAWRNKHKRKKQHHFKG